MASSSSSRHGSRGQCRHLLDKQVVEAVYNRGKQVRGIQGPIDNPYPLRYQFRIFPAEMHRYWDYGQEQHTERGYKVLKK